MLLWASERELYGRARARLRRRSMRGQTCRRSSRAPARRVMFDDNVRADGQVDRCDSSCSELEYARGSRRSESKRLRRDVWSEPQHAHATIEEDHVDGEAHAKRVNAAAGNQQQPLLMVNCFLSAPADASCDERVRDAHLARHTASVDGLKCDCLHDFFPECALLAGAARVDRRRTQGFPQPCAPGQQTIASREGYEAANICASSPEMQQNWEARPSPTRSLESEDSDPDPLLHMDVRMARNACAAQGCANAAGAGMRWSG